MSVDPSSRGWNEHQHRLPWPLSIVAGKLGLNQPAPAEVLDVVGNIKASGNVAAGGTITAAVAGSLLPLSSAIAMPYATGWQDYGTPWSPATYWIDPFGIIHLQGIATTNSATAPAVIATLPLGYRPPINMVYAQVGNSSGYSVLRVDVNDAGQVSIQATVAGTTWAPSATPTNSWVSLSGISFRTT